MPSLKQTLNALRECNPEALPPIGSISVRDLSQRFPTTPSRSLRAILAALEIARFHCETHAILSVGSPIGPLTLTAEGLSSQPYTFGSIVKPQGDVPKLVERSHVSIAIAAIRCYATDDPGGVDEPYLITTVYALDPSRPEDLVRSQRIDNSEFGDIDTGDVFAISRQLADDIVVPGDGEIRIHVQLCDEEMVGSTEGLRDATNATAQAAITAAMSYFGGPVGAGGAILTAATGLLSTIGGAIGDFVGNFWEELFGDDLIDQHEFVIPSSFLRALTTGDPSALNRTSESIPGITYNFPDTIEDDNWLFERGSGTYRVFFKITNVE